ncbi:MAG: FliH/SctL family protein [Oligoflexia bacterium]|nr:FliH/SctL family protein [Oligoflexia bacterium]
MTFQRFVFNADQEEKTIYQAKPYVQKKFDTEASHTVVQTSDIKKDRFFLDETVAGQLGIEEKKRKEFEDKINAEINRRWELTKEKAEVEGFTKGLEEGKSEAYKAEAPRIKERLEKLDNILATFDSCKEKIFLTNEALLIEVIGKIAKMIVLKEVSIDGEYVKRLVIHLLQEIGEKDDLVISLSKEDSENIESLKTAIQQEFGHLKHTVFEISDSLSKGSCQVETKYGVIDASVSTQIEKALESIKSK